jgi:hypothetical protein
MREGINVLITLHVRGYQPQDNLTANVCPKEFVGLPHFNLRRVN